MASSNLRIGDTVSVPGQMYGTLKFVGPVQGKRGVFAGVQLAPEFAARGKNSGDVEGKQYFRTSVPGAGIFLPVDKAEKRHSSGSTTSTPGSLSKFNQGGRTPTVTLPKPNFSQSVGPGSLAARTASPTAMKPPARRESLPRPSSPLRKVNNAPTSVTPAAGKLATPRTRPSLGFNKSTTGAPATVGATTKSSAVRQPSKFGQSLRQSTRGPGSITPNRMKQPASSTASVTTATTDDYPLGPEPAFDESPPPGSGDEGADHTPTPAAGRSFLSKVDQRKYDEEMKSLREQLEDRDRQLHDQTASISEMERSLVDLQALIGNIDAIPEDEDKLPKDVQELRVALREKNEKIKNMTAEFDNNRADFRSTIDTLEMASTETERVYERRVEELLEEIKHLQERNDDVDGVALQFRQLEELVQELEEGLEDARRGEAEARSEVEFLRGEVERGRSELRRERERNRAGDKLNGIDPDTGAVASDELDELHIKLDQKDDEIRGLKAIIQNLNNAAAARSPDRDSRNSRMNGAAFAQGHSKTKSTNTVISVGTGEDTATHLQNQIRDLEVLLQQKSSREEELKEEVTKLRQSVQFGNGNSRFVVPGLEKGHQRTKSNLSKHQSLQSTSTITAGRSSGSSFTQGFGRKAGHENEFVDAEQFPSDKSNNRNSKPAKENGYSDNPQLTPDAASASGETESSSNVMYCEICEESGHDILTCGQMIAEPSSNKNIQQTLKPITHHSGQGLTNKEGLRRANESQGPPPEMSAPPPPGAAARSSLQTLNAANRSSLENVAKPAPLTMSRHSSSNALPKPTIVPADTTNSVKPPGSGLIEGVGDQAGMLAGKETGVIDPEKWCALCERDGHESVDCPIESDF